MEPHEDASIIQPNESNALLKGMEMSPLFRRQGVLERPLPGGAAGAILLDTRSGKCFELNRLGATVWSRIDGARGASEVCQGLAADTRALEDARAFLERLIAEGLVGIGRPGESPT